MCRLYAMHANEPTRVECSLVKAQNALMEQSKGDREGLMHGHGWGVADYPDGVPIIEKHIQAAFQSAHFSRKAAYVYAKTVVAHVRRATVGSASIENTHPFTHGRWIFAHNGTVPNFVQVRDRMIEAIDPLHRTEIKGSTDSEHIFRYLLSLWMHHPEVDLLKTVRTGLRQVIAWSQDIDGEANVGLNIILTDGDRMIGSRIDRTLWYLEREKIYTCSICRKSHVHHSPRADYRAVEIASEPITGNENWKAVPNHSVFSADNDFRLRIEFL
jgi:predicted glutamine amidotransferase